MKPRSTLILIVIIAASCGKKFSNPTPPPAPPSVYVLGIRNDTVVYWKNGVETPISSQSSIIYNFGPNSMSVGGDGVYISGFQPTNPVGSPVFPYQPLFWLNGSAMLLPDTNGSSAMGSGNAIAVSGGDVYVAGIREYAVNESTVPYTGNNGAYPFGGTVATLWKNGSPVDLPGIVSIGMIDSGKYANQLRDDYVAGMYLEGSDVYVVGGSMSHVPAHARYWKNGAPTDLGQGMLYTGPGNAYGYPQTTGIFASGSDVYVSGIEQTTFLSVAVYWHNGTPIYLATDSLSGSIATSVYASGSNAYVAGWQNINGYARATVWKNGTAQLLSGGDTASLANAVFVSGNDVYVAGCTWMIGGNYTACYWKNGVRVQLSNGFSGADGLSISVQ